MHEESSVSTLEKPVLESKDATDELSDLKLSLSSDNDDGTRIDDEVELLVTCEFIFRFLGGSGGGDSSTFLLQMRNQRLKKKVGEIRGIGLKQLQKKKLSSLTMK